MSKEIITTPSGKSVAVKQNFEFNGVAFGYETYIGPPSANATTNTQAHSPTRSLEVVVSGSFMPGDGGYVDTPSFSFNANSLYHASYWVYMDTFTYSIPPTFTLNNGSLTGVTFSNITTVTMGTSSQGSWQQVSADIQTGPTAIGDVNMIFQIGDLTSGMTFYIDDLVIETEDGIDRVYNPIWFRATSNLSSVNGHRYIFQVYDKNNTLLNTSRVISNPNGVGEFDAGLILKDYLSYDLDYTTTNFIPARNSLKEYYIAMSESVNGALVTSVASQSTSMKLFFAQSFSYSSSFLNAQVVGLNLPGLSIAQTAPYYVRNIATASGNVITSFELYTLTGTVSTSVTATGTFNPDGWVQVENNLIPRQTGSFIQTTPYLCLNSSEHPVPQLLWNSGNDYILEDSSELLLTTFDYSEPKRISLDQEETISFLQSASDNVAYVVFTYYDEDNIIVGSSSFNNSFAFSVLATASGTFSFVNSQNMRLDLGTGTFNQTTPVNTSRYEVQLYSSSNLPLGPLIQYVIEDFCEDHVRLMWLNPLGGFDYDNFVLVNDTTNVTQKTFRKELFYNYTSTDRGETTFHSESLFSLTLASKILNQSESDWMKSLFLSPEIYMYYEGQWQAVIISTNSYNKRIARRDKIQIYQFTVRSAHNRVGNP